MNQPKGNAKIQKILEAARVILAEEGYTAATISQIAAKAEVSRGLLHYHFRSKEDLLVQVFRHNMEDILEATNNIFSNAENLSDLAAGLTQALQFILESDPYYFTLFMESWTLVRQGPEAMTLLREFHARFRQAIHDGLEGMAQKGAIQPAKNLGGMAAVLTAIVDGVSLQMTIEPVLSKDNSIWGAVRSAIVLLAGQECES
ncbi:transcriptional regulator, TetR family [Desulfatibacillum aliphaticivorans]|uniref:Transcriptional regulator, TetR family n=1 Tax=Desulfatibacillum aliphaticivorans TaxID=218208 RepID=B8FN75_DESAL|nr:TetR/AcrR family transcriptional regulator [Desulfatibacillum aliphaticivorans]ACL06044.1 transcriptional regulator, TetR family [Desulfatibacillum aliphaticivorans]